MVSSTDSIKYTAYGLRLQVSKSSGYFNVCYTIGEDISYFFAFLDEPDVKGILLRLSKHTTIPDEMYTRVDDKECWVHPNVFTLLAMKLSPAFAVSVYHDAIYRL